MYELASLAKKTHPPRISSGIATLPFIISSFQLSRRSGNYLSSEIVSSNSSGTYGCRHLSPDISRRDRIDSNPLQTLVSSKSHLLKTAKLTCFTSSAAIAGHIALTAPFVPQYALLI
jgi:hypothetical protein